VATSQENVQAVRRYYDDLAKLGRIARNPDASEDERTRAVEAVVARWHEDCEWRPDAAALFEGTSFRGRDGIRRYIAMITEVMESVEIDLHEVRENGGKVVALGRLRAQGRGSGATIEEDLGVVHEVREGLIARGVLYRDKQKALEAAGLRG
jgi:ketosteroid isomerase-like protein